MEGTNDDRVLEQSNARELNSGADFQAFGVLDLWKEKGASPSTQTQEASVLRSSSSSSSSSSGGSVLPQIEWSDSGDNKNRDSQDRGTEQRQPVETDVRAEVGKMLSRAAAAVAEVVKVAVVKGSLQHPDESRETREAGGASAARRSPHLFGD